MICSDCSIECLRTSGRQLRCVSCRKRLAVRKASAWYEKNKNRRRLYDEQRRLEKRDLYRAASKRFREKHPGRKNADTQKRRLSLEKRMPPWANEFFIEEIYDLAVRRTKATGTRWVVDHVIPLRGKTVSGLHIETNLQVVPRLYNAHKSNHYSFTHEGRA